MNKGQIKEKLKNLPEETQEKVAGMGIRQATKFLNSLSRTVTKVYNKVSPESRRLILSNPQRPIEDYPEEDREVIQELLKNKMGGYL